MMPDGDQILLVPLSKWVSRQYENFCSEAFASLLRYIAARHEIHLSSLLAKLFQLDAEDARRSCQGLRVSTQLAADGYGILDIALCGEEACLLIEAKVGAAEGYRQLESYVGYLAQQRTAVRSIIYLTDPFALRKEKPPNSAEGTSFWHIRWNDVCHFLAEVSEECSDPVLAFLVGEFEQLLCHWGLVMNTRVPGSVVEGARAIPSLTHMLGAALHRCESIQGISKSKSHFYIGWNLQLEGDSDKNSWIGFYFEQPERIWTVVRPRVVAKLRQAPSSAMVIEMPKLKDWSPPADYPSLDLHKSGFFSCTDPNDQAGIIGEFVTAIGQAASS